MALVCRTGRSDRRNGPALAVGRGPTAGCLLKRVAESCLQGRVAAFLDQFVDCVASQVPVQRVEDGLLAQQVGSASCEAGIFEECRCGSDEPSGALELTQFREGPGDVRCGPHGPELVPVIKGDSEGGSPTARGVVIAAL